MRNTLILSLLIAIAATACQTNRHNHSGEVQGRFVASAQVFNKFLRSVSQRSGESAEVIERKILNHIQSRSGNNTHGNWTALGLTESEAKKITSLSDDLPYMPKVKKWALENITTVTKSIDHKVASEIFEQIVNNKTGLVNPYKVTSTSRGAVRARQNGSSPFNTVNEKQKRVLDSIREIKDSSTSKLYSQNLVTMQRRGVSNPAIHANGQEIVESAANITKKTGHNAMGDGCEAFVKEASPDILSIKANVDMRASDIVTEMAHTKAGRSFASIDEVPSANRLTLDEVDTARQRAFQDVLGYTDDEARAAVRRLKNKPCKMY